MNKTFINLFSISLLAVMLAACGSQATPTAIPTLALDNPSGSSPAASGGRTSAAAVVVPARYVELAFATGGAVKTVEVQAGDSVTANQPLVTLDTAILEARVREAEANVVTAESQLAYLIRTGTDNERLEAAKAGVERAKAGVEIAKAQLAQAVLTAPFEGTIASVQIHPAEFASPGQIIIVMGDLGKFKIETTDLSETDIIHVKIGQSASVYIEALGINVNGTVSDIARISETVGGDVVYKVTIELDEQPAGLRWGMSADVDIETE